MSKHFFSSDMTPLNIFKVNSTFWSQLHFLESAPLFGVEWSVSQMDSVPLHSTTPLTPLHVLVHVFFMLVLGKHRLYIYIDLL